MFRVGAGRHFLKLEVKLYNRDFFLPLFPRPHYKYSWHLITFGGDTEGDCSNPGGQVAGALLPELTPPYPVHKSQWIYLHRFKVQWLISATPALGTSYRWAGARRERRAGGSDFPAKPSQVPEPGPWVMLTNTEQRLTSRGTSICLVCHEMASAHAETLM